MTYWEERALAQEEYFNAKSNQLISEVQKLYNKAFIDIRRDINRILSVYMKNGEMTRDEALEYLNRYESQKTLDTLLRKISTITDDKIKQDAWRKLNAPAYRARISRLQAVQDNIDVELKRVADVQAKIMTERFVDVISESYYRTLYDFQMGVGVGFDFAMLPMNAINEALKHSWSGNNYSSNVWSDTQLCAKKAKEIISSGLATGKTINRMTDEILGNFDVARYKAARLIRTENNYFANKGRTEAYKESGTEKYVFLATLDLRTCSVCGALDHLKFFVSMTKVGENYPPIHPNDRCTTYPYIERKNIEELKRRARDPKTGKSILVDRNMTYSEWKKKFVDGGDK